MAAEIAEIPEAAARLLDQGAGSIGAVAAALRSLSPVMMATVARGSSDHVATTLSYGLGMMSGIVPASYPPARAISQSGRSADIIAAAHGLMAGGATLVVLTNRVDGPLAQLGGHVLDIRAGPERAVAATKSFVNALLAGAMLLAEWRDDAVLRGALARMPAALRATLSVELTDLMPVLSIGGAADGSGPWPIAGRRRRGCAEGDGTLRSVRAGLFGGGGAARADADPARRISCPGFDPGGPFDGTRPIALPDPVSLHPLLDLVPIYVALEAAARARGADPDAPDRLEKETVTL